MYSLDSVRDDAYEVIDNLDKEYIWTWDEQREFLIRHRDEFGDLFELALLRFKLAFPKHGDNIFHLTDAELQAMEDEEDADKLVYGTVRKYKEEMASYRVIDRYKRR
jgi:hypothetical protein